MKASFNAQLREVCRTPPGVNVSRRDIAKAAARDAEKG